MDIPAIKKTLAEYLHPHADFAFVFGSIVSGHFCSESDVDCAAFFRSAPDWRALIGMQAALAEMLGRDVDVISLNTADSIITMQVLANGELLFCSDRDAVNCFRAQKISEYLDFKQSRACIEKRMQGVAWHV